MKQVNNCEHQEMSFHPIGNMIFVKCNSCSAKASLPLDREGNFTTAKAKEALNGRNFNPSLVG
jgi:hypothetical protein